MDETKATRPLVLHVDDNDGDLELSRFAIEEQAGDAVQYIGLSNAGVALTLLRKRDLAVSLLLLDINIPGVNGWDVIAALHHDALLAGIPPW